MAEPARPTSGDSGQAMVYTAVVAGLAAVVYGIVQTMSLLKADAGNEKMQEIAKGPQ